MKLQEDVKPLSELENSASQLIRSVAEERRTVLITDGGKARAVLMDVASYDKWRQSVALLQLIAQSEADIEAGRVMPQEEAFARAERAIKRAERAAKAG